MNISLWWHISNLSKKVNSFDFQFFLESIPHLLINLFLTFYVIGGAAAFQLIDENIKHEKFYNVIQFTFTTIATVGILYFLNFELKIIHKNTVR